MTIRPSSPTECIGFDEATLGFYAAEADAYVANGPEHVNRQLNAFLDLLTPGARILELGCGNGRDSEVMLARGFDVDATDGVPQIAQHASMRLGRAVRIMRFDELNARGIYDAVWANACLLHAPRAALPATLARIFEALKPGGLHFASFKSGGQEGRDRFGRYFNYMSKAQFVEAYGMSGCWEIETTIDSVGSGYDGLQTPWVAITARKPGSA